MGWDKAVFRSKVELNKICPNIKAYTVPLLYYNVLKSSNHACAGRVALFHFACVYNTVYNGCSNTMFWQSTKQYRKVVILLHIYNRVNII